MWILFLNDMRFPNIESLAPMFRADTKEQLKAFLERERVEPYKDGSWAKAYRQGGPLEWCNPPWDADERQHFADAGTVEDWVSRARREYEQKVLSLPVVA
jgi:hypothetical protein